MENGEGKTDQLEAINLSKQPKVDVYVSGVLDRTGDVREAEGRSR